MRIPVATALGRRDRIWPAVLASAAFHVSIVTWAVVRRPAPEIDLNQKPIVARLVRLGEKRPEDSRPRKVAPPEPAAPPAPAAAPVLAAPAKPAAPAANAPPARPAASGTGRSGTTLASVLSKVQKDADRDRWGSPDGDPSGDSETGSEGDRYIALVDRAIRTYYHPPLTIPERERLHLETTVVVWIEPDGRIVRFRQERSSGNPQFDGAVERSIKA